MSFYFNCFLAIQHYRYPWHHIHVSVIKEESIITGAVCILYYVNGKTDSVLIREVSILSEVKFIMQRFHSNLSIVPKIIASQYSHLLV